jgi:hypothetical protein
MKILLSDGTWRMKCCLSAVFFPTSAGMDTTALISRSRFRDALT